MSAFEAARERYGPLAEVYIGRTENGREMLYLGEICGTSMYDRYEDRRFALTRIPVTPRPAIDLVEWIKTGPAELNRAMEADLPVALGETVGVTEWYPQIERREP